MSSSNKYKESIFNVHHSIGLNWYVFNTLHKGLLRLKSNDIVLSDIADPVLINNGFVVPIDKDEHADLTRIRFKTGNTSQFKYFRIVTTTACNARCSYCYEQGMPSVSMSPEVAHAVAEFICRKSAYASKISLCWFGGEPFLNSGVISTIIQDIEKWHNNRNLQIRSSFISNGSLIDDSMVFQMTHFWHTSDIQISMDGCGWEYEQIKRYIGNQYSFETIVSNIKRIIAAGIKVRIRINVDRHSIGRAKRLVDFFSSEISPSPLFTLYPGFLFDGFHDSNPAIISNNDWPERLGFIDYIHSKGYTISLLPGRRDVACYACRKDNFLIDPKGNLFKCAQHFAERPPKPLGTVFDDRIEQGSWTDISIPDECMSCPCLPMCQGGCKAARLTNLRLDRCFTSLDAIHSYIEREVSKLS